MDMMRRNVRGRLLTVLLMLVMVGCISVATPAAERVTLNYIHSNPIEIPLVAIFEATYPYIKVVRQELPFRKFFETIEAKLVKTSETPDVFEVDQPLNTSYAVRGFTLVLDDYLAKYPELAQTDDFLPIMVEAATHKEKWYSIPRETSSQGLFYNKDIFNKYGVAPPELAIEKRWIWKQVVEAANKLTIDANGDGRIDIWGIAFDQVDRPYQMLPLVQSLGENMLGPDQLTGTGYVDSPNSIRAGQFYYDLYNTWKVAPKGLISGETSDSFGAGKLAMFIGGYWNRARYETHYPDLNWDVAPHPYFEGGVVATPCGGWASGVNPNSKHKDEAALFIMYINSPPLCVIHNFVRKTQPARLSVYEFFADFYTKHPFNIAFHDSQNTAVVRPITPGYLEWELIITKAYADMRAGAKPEEALGRAAKQIDRQLKKYASLLK